MAYSRATPEIPLHTSPVNILVILRLADRHSNDGSHDEAHGIKRDPLPEWEHLNDRFPKKVGNRDDRTDDHHLERHGIDHGRIGDSHRCRLSLLRGKNTGYILFLHIAAVHFLSGYSLFSAPQLMIHIPPITATNIPMVA